MHEFWHLPFVYTLYTVFLERGVQLFLFTYISIAAAAFKASKLYFDIQAFDNGSNFNIHTHNCRLQMIIINENSVISFPLEAPIFEIFPGWEYLSVTFFLRTNKYYNLQNSRQPQKCWHLDPQTPTHVLDVICVVEWTPIDLFPIKSVVEQLKNKTKSTLQNWSRILSIVHMIHFLSYALELFS